MALGELRLIESKAAVLSAEVLAGLNYGFARYFYRAEMPDREFEIAKKYVTRALDAYKALGDLYGQAEAVHLQGLIEMQRGNYEGAGVLFDESLRLDELAGARVFFRGEYERHMGFVLYFEGKLEESLLYFRRSVEARKTAGATDPLVFAKITLASVLNQLGNDHEALPTAKDAMTSARKIGSANARADDYRSDRERRLESPLLAELVVWRVPGITFSSGRYLALSEHRFDEFGWGVWCYHDHGTIQIQNDRVFPIGSISAVYTE